MGQSSSKVNSCNGEKNRISALESENERLRSEIHNLTAAKPNKNRRKLENEKERQRRLHRIEVIKGTLAKNQSIHEEDYLLLPPEITKNLKHNEGHDMYGDYYSTYSNK